ncbi:alpha-1,3-arabinosyltransferase XAT2-like [Solanum dulcamara]|uniref:alpha-1,3-arabinosyltransferase XAT2-like n=1 Tax=Solanum dulcamara TaxID=45834 RepID=UPI002485B396|nr:alpha-1,3-arabinosyltransferase XAT2-like [Solanum dulcamara]
MKYDSFFARSFSKHEQKKLGIGAFVSCFIFAATFCILFKPEIRHFRVVNVKVSLRGVPKILAVREEITKPKKPYFEIEQEKQICNVTHPRADLCEMNGDIRIHGNSSTIFFVSIDQEENKSWNIRPYARKGDNRAMDSVTNLIVKKLHISQQIPICTRNYTVPAVVFSTKGYAGNHFHDFTDVLIPLFQTSRRFNGEVQFLITNKMPWWIKKFKPVLQRLSKYEVIDIDKEKDVLCCPSMTIGLKANKEFSINTSESHYTMMDFTKFLKSTYSLKRKFAVRLKKNADDHGRKNKPRLLIISRRRTRRFTNVEEIVTLARSLGFKVVVEETGENLAQVAKKVNSFDVLMGVHGAGLTNMVFLPENATVIQIVGLGMEWVSKEDFQIPAIDMNLKYLGYKISVNESSLIQQYPLEHHVLKNAPGNMISPKGWASYRKIYLDQQDIKIDVNRFRGTLLKALELLRS